MRVFLILFVMAMSATALALETFENSELVIETASGERYRFDIEIATTPAQMAQGLMFRDSLAPDAGMLFVSARERRASMWMRNTLIPLDMLFIAGDGRIAKIHANAVPHSEESIRADQPVKAVLEVNGGTAARLGIRAGDRVLHPVFGTAPAGE